MIKANLKTCASFAAEITLQTRCDIVTDPKVRKQIIINGKRCFVCLRLGHSAKASQGTINVLNVTVGTIT